MSTNPADPAVLLNIASAPANSINDVIQLMEKLDAALAANDGLRWFNLLYLDVTKEVRDHPPQDGWKDQVWIGPARRDFRQPLFCGPF